MIEVAKVAPYGIESLTYVAEMLEYSQDRIKVDKKTGMDFSDDVWHEGNLPDKKTLWEIAKGLEKPSTKLLPLVIGCVNPKHLWKRIKLTQGLAEKYRIEKQYKKQVWILHPRKEHKFTLIWLHGLGGSGSDFIDLFMNENFVNLPDGCKIILPTAEHRPFTCAANEPLNSWFNTHTWFWPSFMDITQDLLEVKYDQTDLQLSNDYIISSFIDPEIKALGSPARVFLGGFMQGACMALASYMLFDGN
jgi:hypothetical protein